MKSKLNANDKQLAIQMYQRGASLAEIGKIMGIGNTTIYGYLQEAGMPVHSQARSEASKRAAVTRAQHHGQTLTTTYTNRKQLIIKLLEHLMDEIVGGM